MAATLYILGGRSVGRSFEVEGRALLGRDPSCEIRLGDKSISRKHARLERDGLGWRIVDLDSRNGLHVAGERTPKTSLVDGQEFLLGEVPIRFRLVQEGLGEEESLEFEEPIAKPAAAQSADEAQAPELEEEISLEEEIVLGEAPDATPESELALRRSPVAAQSAAHARQPVSLAEAPASRLQRDLDPRAKLLAGSKRSGLLGGDLSQRPAWFLVLLFLVLACCTAGIAYFVFAAVRSLQG